MRSRLKILILLEATLGGTRKYVVDLLRGIDKERFDVIFAYATERADAPFYKALEEFRCDGNIRLVELRMCRAVRPWRDAISFFRLLRLLWKERFDLIHCHSSKAGFLGRVASRLIYPRTPNVYSPNAMALNIHWVYKYLEKFAALFTDRIIAAIDSEKCEIVENRIIANDKIDIIHLGVEIPMGERSSRLRDELRLSPETLIVFNVGRCTQQKDPVTYFRTAKVLAQRRNDFHFVWLGNGDLEGEVKSFIQSEKIGSLTTFLDNRPDTQVLMSGSDIFMFTSLYESFGYATCEAMSWGIPVVATDVVGTRSLVADKVTGFLAPAGDAEGLAEKTQRLFDDRTLRGKMGAEGKKRVEQFFSCKKMVQETQGLYLSLASSHQPQFNSSFFSTESE